MSDGIVKIHGKDYVTVQKRLELFREQFPDHQIHTEVLSCADLVLIKCTIKDPSGNIIATSHAEEERNSSNINKTSAVENCETSAVGRCLAFAFKDMSGSGSSIASADEVVSAMNQQNDKKLYERFSAFTSAFQKHYLSMMQFEKAYFDGDYDTAKEIWNEVEYEDRVALFLAPTKGGFLSTEQRNSIKTSFKENP